MRLDWLQRLTDHAGPFATVCTDVTRDGSEAGPGLENRWVAHADRLSRMGAPDGLVQALSGVVRSRTRRGGRTHRVVVASGDGVLLDQVLPARGVPDLPPGERSTWGPVPDLVPVVRALARSTSCLLVEVDANGTHLLVMSPRGNELEAATVLEDRDVLAQVPGGGWVHSRTLLPAGPDAPADVAGVARRVDDQVRRHRPDLVLVVGTDGPVAAVLGRCTEVAAPVVRLAWPLGEGGPQARVQELTRVLDGTSRGRDEAVLARFGAAGSRASGAVTGLAAVVAALQRTEVEELLLRDGGLGRQLWATGRPQQVGTSSEDVVGVLDQPVPVAADVALVWAAVGTAAGVTLVPAGLAGDLEDGVGALLRDRRR